MVCTSNSSIYTDLKLRKKKKKFLISGEFISWFWCVVTTLRFITVLIIINALIIKKKTQDQKLHEDLYTWYEKTNRV